MAKIKVLFFYPNEFFGPEMTVFAQILRHLDRSRFAPYLVLDSGAAGTLGLSEVEGITIRRWKFGRALRGGLAASLLSSIRLPLTMLSLIRYTRRERNDIVQCAGTPRAAILGFLLARLAGARLALHYHVLPGRYAGPRRVVENTVARRADHAVAVSEFLAREVPRTGIPPSKISVVVNGANLSRFHPGIDGSRMRQEYGIASDEVLILQLARIIQQKRQEDVVRAFAIARRQAPQLRCLLVGWEDPRYEGPFPSYKAELEHIAAQANLGDSLIIAPARPEAPEVIAASDIVAMPSVGDAWNLAVTEAMAVGKPVIGSDSGGVPEQIVDGVTGFIVPLGATEALAEKMVALAQDPALRAQMGKAARERAEQYFDEQGLAAAFAPIYEKLVGNVATRTQPA